MLTIEEVRKEFVNTNFHELKSKLDEYGVGEAFVSGKKKVDIIEEAITLLATISTEVPDEFPPTTEDVEEVDEDEDDGEIQELQVKEASKLHVTVTEGLTKEQIQKAIDCINLNLLSATENQARVLRAKRDVLDLKLKL